MCGVCDTYSMSPMCWLREFLVGSGWAGQIQKLPNQDTPTTPLLGFPFFPAWPPRVTILMLLLWLLCYHEAVLNRRNKEEPDQRMVECGIVWPWHPAGIWLVLKEEEIKKKVSCLESWVQAWSFLESMSISVNRKGQALAKIHISTMAYSRLNSQKTVEFH